MYSTHHFDYKNDKRRKKPALLLVHGYQGSCIQFYWLISKLRHDYDVTTIDLLGMGCSGRAPLVLKSKTTNSAIFYFCHSIEAWMQETKYREKCLNGQYAFMAHSLGGYIATHYVMNYPQSVTKLILLSPAGLTAQGNWTPQDETMAERLLEMTLEKLWDRDYTPQHLLRDVYKLGQTQHINAYLNNFIDQDTRI